MARICVALPAVVFVAAASACAGGDSDSSAPNPSAQQFYEEGMVLEKRRLGEDDFRAAEALFRRAIEADSAHALAHAGLARVHAGMVHFMYDPTDERRRLSREEAAAALRLVPGLPEGHYAMGLYHYWGNKQYDSAAAELDLAAASLATDAEVQAMAGFVQRRKGDWERDSCVYRAGVRARAIFSPGRPWRDVRGIRARGRRSCRPRCRAAPETRRSLRGRSRW